MDLNYIKTLKERGGKSRIYRKYQLTGLLIADSLNDREHKAIYIKLAKEHNPDKLLSLAKDIRARARVNNKGAYFMRMVQRSKLPILPLKPEKPKQLRLKFKPKNGSR